MIPPAFPDEWRNANLEDPAVRAIFADWLEERGDWRADEVRRTWIRKKSHGADTYFALMRGPWTESEYHIEYRTLPEIRKELVFLIHHMWYTEFDWREEKEKNKDL